MIDRSWLSEMQLQTINDQPTTIKYEQFCRLRKNPL